LPVVRTIQPNFVRQGHEEVAADPGLQVLLREVALAPGEDLDELLAEVGGERTGVPLRPVGRVARRHDGDADPVRAERIDRDEEHERGVHAPGKPQDDMAEAVLRDVVARAEDEGLVDLLDGGRPHGDRALLRTDAGVGDRSCGDERPAVGHDRPLGP